MGHTVALTDILDRMRMCAWVTVEGGREKSAGRHRLGQTLSIDSLVPNITNIIKNHLLKPLNRGSQQLLPKAKKFYRHATANMKILPNLESDKKTLLILFQWMNEFIPSHAMMELFDCPGVTQRTRNYVWWLTNSQRVQPLYSADYVHFIRHNSM